MRMDDDIIIYRRDWDFAVYYTIFVFDLGFTLYIVIYIYMHIRTRNLFAFILFVIRPDL